MSRPRSTRRRWPTCTSRSRLITRTWLTWPGPGFAPRVSSRHRLDRLMDGGFLALADWRRRVAEIYAAWRRESATDPLAACQSWRRARDELLRDHPQSPLPSDQRARFGGLPYFDYDPAYRLAAVVEPTADADPALPLDHLAGGLLQLPSSGAEQFSFRRIGVVRLSGPLAGTALPLYWMNGYAGG